MHYSKTGFTPKITEESQIFIEYIFELISKIILKKENTLKE